MLIFDALMYRLKKENGFIDFNYTDFYTHHIVNRWNNYHPKDVLIRFSKEKIEHHLTLGYTIYLVLCREECFNANIGLR